MDMHLFTALRLPAHVTPPVGALNSTGVQSKHNELVLRSRMTQTLASQMASLREDAATVQFELESRPNNGYLVECHREHLLGVGGYTHRAHEHPAWRAGLAAAGEAVMAKRGALMVDVVAAFFLKKQEVLLQLHSWLGESVHVPFFFCKYNFLGDDAQHTVCSPPHPPQPHPSTPTPSTLATHKTRHVPCHADAAAPVTHQVQTLHSHNHYRIASSFICNNLNVVRLPVKVAGHWHWRQALLPNIVGLSDEDFSEQLGHFYQLEAVRSNQGATMTPEDVRNLKATLPAGSGSRAVVDFLIAKFADDETRRVLGYTPGRVKSLISRYDDFTQSQRVQRARAELKVAGKVIKTTGEGIRQIRKAADYEMRRVTLKEKVRARVRSSERCLANTTEHYTSHIQS